MGCFFFRSSSIYDLRLIQEAVPRGCSKRLFQEVVPRGCSKRLFQEADPRGRSKRPIQEADPRGRSKRPIQEAIARFRREPKRFVKRSSVKDVTLLYYQWKYFPMRVENKCFKSYLCVLLLCRLDPQASLSNLQAYRFVISFAVKLY